MSTGTRSRFGIFHPFFARITTDSVLGCRTCRHKHRKCDEKRPACGACVSRNLECKYQVALKWASHESISSFGTNEAARQKQDRSSRQTPNASSPQGLLSSAASIASAQTNNGHDSTPRADHPSVGFNQPPIATPDNRPPVNMNTYSSPYDFSTINQFQDDFPQSTRENFQEQQIETGDDLDNDTYDAISENSEEEVSSSPWVLDNTLSNLMFQIFENPGEEIAFTYCKLCHDIGVLGRRLICMTDFKRVCSCIPAYDCGQNPYRKLALIALAYPVLLHGILSVSTAHMYNYGRSNERLLSSRQARALNSLQVALNAIQHETDQRRHDGRESESLLDKAGVYSILSPREIALAAIMMQTSSVLMTGIGNIEIHMSCAWHFIRDLDYFHHRPTSLFARILVYRFAMVDVVLAHLRFRQPLAGPGFYMYQQHEELDQLDPPFREMQGCPQPVLCFLSRIASFAADIMQPDSSLAQIQTRAYGLESEMRTWGQRYHEAMIQDAQNLNPLPKSSREGSRSDQPDNSRSDLDIVCECFYWTAHLLLMRRVFLDTTWSTRVQLVRRHMFCLMDKLRAGCGADSSLPFPFYIAAREAVTLEERDWVRRKHREMLDAYRDRSREYLMISTEQIWDKAASMGNAVFPDLPFWKTPYEKFIRDMDRQALYFMF